ncbi:MULTISPECIES: long-chain-fatty-acid--CoA ligase [unclassified Frondihabitans]|uniref:long-chain-fatty-acid--CoA ligase n=1 Tax=unclassified Frondihabitans TaxID=2626248 RepID=UPI000F5027FE|nr:MULTISPECIES: long-chain-fatty-acid--CoA ligase [unclassified Frondihabitans]RPE76408.1 long-chain acyl-CoA synthetase [Frondihabitans sp. PhB153]RPF05316.1 long-chain acyl-CoA synthetase [Frondihabitans sp. PhB161]
MTIDSARPWLGSYAPGIPHDIEPATGSLIDLVRDTAQKYPKAVALEYFGAETTYEDMVEEIQRAAEGLRRLGVKKGDTVALILPNCPQHVVAFYAILRLGAIVVEHNPLYTPRELQHQFEDHGARFAIAWDKTVATLQKFPAEVPLDGIVSIDVTKAMLFSMRAQLRLPIKKARESRERLTTSVSGTTPWEKIAASPRIDANHPRPETGDLALIQYTSGTTGSPKGAMLTHGNLLSNAAQCQAWIPQIQEGSSVVYAVLPMFHAYGLTLCLTFAMRMGSRLVLFPAFEPSLVLKAMKKHPPTFLPAVPPIYQRLQRAADDAGVSLNGIEIAISGAMPLSASVVEPWEERSHGWLIEGYGLSETSPVLMANPVADSRRAGTVGMPLPSTEARAVDPDDPTKDVPLGERGELVVRGPQVFSGYYKRPDETAEVFTGDWFRTGDIVTISDDGYFTIVDRIKDLIITGGFNVSPSEVEDTLKQFAGVADVAVVGLGSSSNEQVTAAVVVEPGTTLDEAALREFARENLAAYKVPRRIVVVDSLPKSLIGKVIRRHVKEQLLKK